MAVNCIVTLAMIDNYHFTIAGKPISVNNPSFFDHSYFFAKRRLDINAFTEDFAVEFRMPKFTKRSRYLPSHRPFEATPQCSEADARRRRGRQFSGFLEHGPASDFFHHLFQAPRGGFHLLQGARSRAFFPSQARQ